LKGKSLVGISHVSRRCLAHVSHMSRSNMCETPARHLRNMCQTRARQLGVNYASITLGLPFFPKCSENIQKMVKQCSFYFEDNGVMGLIGSATILLEKVADPIKSW